METVCFAFIAGSGCLAAAAVFFGSRLLEERLTPLLLTAQGIRRRPLRYDPPLWDAIAGRPSRAEAADPAERRSSLRRGGPEIAVLVARRKEKAAAVQGRVVDRSRTGLRLTLPRIEAAGTPLYVLSPDAPDGELWVPVEVRHARPHQGGSLVGCSFAESLPWAVLLLFG